MSTSKNYNSLLSAFSARNTITPQSTWNNNDWLNYVQYNPQAEALSILSDAGLDLSKYGTEVLNMTQGELQNRLNAYNQFYNSEEQKAQRERAAGLNPDIQGIQQASNANVGMPNLQNTAEQDAAARTQAASSMISSIGGLVDEVISVVGQAYGIEAQDIQNNIATADLFGRNLANSKTINDNMANYTTALEQFRPKPEDFNGDVEAYNKAYSQWEATANGWIMDRLVGDERYMNHRERRNAKRVKSQVSAYLDDTRSDKKRKYEYFENILKGEKAAIQADVIQHNEDARDDFRNNEVIVYKAARQSGLLRLATDIQDTVYQNLRNPKSEIRAKLAELGFTADYFEAWDGKKKAALEQKQMEEGIESANAGQLLSNSQSNLAQQQQIESGARTAEADESAKQKAQEVEIAATQIVIADATKRFMDNIEKDFNAKIKEATDKGQYKKAQRLSIQRDKAILKASVFAQKNLIWNETAGRAITTAEQGVATGLGAAAAGKAAGKSAGTASRSGGSPSYNTPRY